MQIRPLQNQDMLAVRKIHSISYLFPVDLDATQRQIESGELSAENWWGSFTPEGALAACINNAPYQIRYDGGAASMGGIGGVATLPEHRYGGAVRQIFAVLLRDARDKGEVFSTLYPFSHEFYQKFGYEHCYQGMRYDIPLAALQQYKHTGWVKRLDNGECLDELSALYDGFASRYNIAALRTKENIKDRLRSQPFKDQSFLYLIGEGDEPLAYLRYRMSRDGGHRILDIADHASAGARGFRAMLGFLSRMTADFETMRAIIPSDIPIAALIPNPRDTKLTVVNDLMGRPTHVQQTLAKLKRPQGASFTVRVRDGFLPENEGTYRVDDSGASLTDQPADLEMDVRACAPLALGYIDLNGAAYRNDVTIHGNYETLERVFVKKPLYMSDYF